MATAKKSEQEQVVLITTRVLTPYAAGEIFSIDKKAAQKLLDADNCGVRLYDEKKDAEALAEQRGKTEDVEPEAPVTPAV